MEPETLLIDIAGLRSIGRCFVSCRESVASVLSSGCVVAENTRWSECLVRNLVRSAPVLATQTAEVRRHRIQPHTPALLILVGLRATGRISVQCPNP
jgi:hypothetical protein